jgi:hypothetical protein
MIIVYHMPVCRCSLVVTAESDADEAEEASLMGPIDMHTVSLECYAAVTEMIEIDSDHDKAQGGLLKGRVDRSVHLNRPSTTEGAVADLA